VGRAPHVPAPGETVLGGELGLAHGGKGGNQAVAAARMGVPVALAGAVGDDDHGRALAAGLRAEGVDLSRLRTVPGASGAALITVADNGENAITVLPGANRDAPLPSTDDTLAGVGAVLMQLELPLATVTAWALHAQGCGVPVLLNAAPAAELPEALWPTLDTVLVNRDELARLAGTADLDAGLQALRERGLRCVIVTLGAMGVIASVEGRRVEWPALQVPVVDTTGAGDTLAGVWAAWRLRGLPDEQALARANVAAALACTRAGARTGMPTAKAAAAYARQAGVDWPQDRA
jgi:ribokinase